MTSSASFGSVAARIHPAPAVAAGFSRIVGFANRLAGSPWAFADKDFERAFEKSIAKKAAANVWWLVFAIVPFSLHDTVRFVNGSSNESPIPDLQMDVATTCRLFSTCILILSWLLNTRGTKSKHVARSFTSWDERALATLAVRVFGLAMAWSSISAQTGDWEQLSLVARWACVAFCAVQSFGEAWFTLFLGVGVRPCFYLSTSLETFAGSAIDQVFLAWFVLGTMAMYAWFGTRRAAFLRRLATISLSSTKPRGKESAGSLASGSKKQGSKGSTGPGTDEQEPQFHAGAEQVSGAAATQMHDDYFPDDEWALVAAKVEEESREMVQLRASAPASSMTDVSPYYEWEWSDVVLGSGSYGKVKLVRHRTTQRICAVKISSRETRDGANEARMFRMLRHPHVVELVQDIAPAGEERLLVLELCEFGSLDGVMRSLGKLDEAATRWLTRNILSGLLFLHRNAISHQDIKPGNTLLARSGGAVVAKLADLGSCTWGDTCQRDRLRGTPVYMAPEVLNPRASTRRMDVWSLGCTVFEMLAGTQYSTTGKVRSEGRAYAAFPPSLAPDALAFVSACLRVDASHRPTALALEKLSFVADMESCPTESPSMALLLGKPTVQWENRHSFAPNSLVLPGLAAWHWTMALSPAGIWRVLLDLERPFVDPAHEHRFQRHIARTRFDKLIPVLRVLLVYYALFSLPEAMRQTESVHWLVPKALLAFVVVKGGLLFWPMIPNAWFDQWLCSRLLIHAYRICSLFRACFPFHPDTPIHLLCLFATSCIWAQMFPVAGECIAYSLSWTVTSSAFSLLAAMQCEDGTWLCDHELASGALYKRVDNALYFTVTIVASTAISAFFSLRIRRAERSAFREKLVEEGRKKLSGADTANSEAETVKAEAQPVKAKVN